MEGLETSVVPVNDLERTLRLDAEFFQRRFLRSAAAIHNWKCDDVAMLTEVSDGNHFSISADFVDSGHSLLPRSRRQRQFLRGSSLAGPHHPRGIRTGLT